MPKRTLHFVDIDGWDENAVETLIAQADKIPEEYDKINVWSTTAKNEVFKRAGYVYGSDSNNFIVIK